MEKSSGLSIASLVAALVAGPDDVPEFAYSAADWELFGGDESGARQSDIFGQNVDPVGNSLGCCDVV